MLNPSQTPTSAASGGFSAPNDENQIKNAMQPIKRTVRIIWATRLLGRPSRRNENKPDTMTNASPVKNDQRPPMDKTTKPTINKVWLVTNLMSVFFIARVMPNFQSSDTRGG